MSCWLLCPSSNLDESRITETLANNGIASRLKWVGWTYSAILYCQWLPSVPGLDRLRDSQPSWEGASQEAGPTTKLSGRGLREGKRGVDNQALL
jgi:hypothetical protein